MKNKELIEYLRSFSEEEYVHVLVASPEDRVFYRALNIGGITDQKFPVITIEVGVPVPMDDEMVKACEADEELEE